MAISGAYAVNDAVSFNNCLVEVDQTPSASSFKPIDSWATSVSVSGGDTPTEQAYPFAGGPIVMVGNINPFRVVIEVVYTEGATDPFNEIYDDYIANPGLNYDTRWVPKGSGSGYNRFTTSGGKLVNCTLPQGAGEGANATMFTFEIECSTITRDSTT